MDFDMDAARAAYDPWDFAITIEGARHPVREITVEEFARMQAGAFAPGSAAEADLFVSLFPQTPAATVKGWDPFLCDEVSNAISAYLAGHLEKKRQKIREAVAAAARAGRAAGRGAGST